MSEKLPAYVGAEVGGGNYLLYKISKVSQPEKVDSNRRASPAERVRARFSARKTFAAYLAGLRLRTRSTSTSRRWIAKR
jgi:hypothetical protein